METGGEQTTITPEFLQNIQSAVNSQGVLGQVQVIETENGPVTVLFLEEGADASGITGENMTISVSDGSETLTETVVEDPNTQIEYQYIQAGEDYTQLLQEDGAGSTGDAVTVANTGEETIATVQPVIDLPMDQRTTETIEQSAVQTTDTYYITDTGEILKIDSSLLSENSGATLQLQNQDGSLQVLNPIQDLHSTDQVQTQQSYTNSAAESTSISYGQTAPFQFTATKMDSPLVIDTPRVEEPKVLSYKTTNRQRVNIMGQPAQKSVPTSIQPKSLLTNQNVKTQTSLLSQTRYKTVKHNESGTTTTEIVYPPSYPKQTVLYPNVPKQKQIMKQIYQPKLKTYPQQVLTTVAKSQSLTKPIGSQSMLTDPVMNKQRTTVLPGAKKVLPHTAFTKQPTSNLTKFASPVTTGQSPTVTKQQTDLLSAAMKQAEVPQQVVLSVPPKTVAPGSEQLVVSKPPAITVIPSLVSQGPTDMELVENNLISVSTPNELQTSPNLMTALQQTTIPTTTGQSMSLTATGQSVSSTATGQSISSTPTVQSMTPTTTGQSVSSTATVQSVSLPKMNDEPAPESMLGASIPVVKPASEALHNDVEFGIDDLDLGIMETENTMPTVDEKDSDANLSSSQTKKSLPDNGGKQNAATEMGDDSEAAKDTEPSSHLSRSSGQLEPRIPASQSSHGSAQMKSISVPDSDVTIQLFADGTLVTRDKSGTNYSQVKLEDLGLDMTMLEGNTDIELLIVQGDGKEVRATINTSKHVNPTTESVTHTTNTASAISSVASGKDDATEVTRSTEATVAATSNESRPYKCSMCPRTFKFYRTFRCHEIVHTKAVTFTCHLCQRLFAREVNLNSHLELHKKKGTAMKSEHEKDKADKLEKWDCNLCEKEFGGYHALKRHKEQVHEAKAKIPCPICGKEFQNESNVLRHSRVHVGPFTCPHCVTVFMEREEYNEHIKTDHADLMYPCSVCDTVLPSKKAYARHVNNVHKDSDSLKELMKKMECSVCNKMFLKQNLLDKHMLIHSSEWDYECPKCHKTFKALWTLEHHIKAEHNNEVVFTCSECNEEFALKNKLDLHVKLYHNGHYQCLECYEEFPQRVLLEEHQFTNHELGFTCSKCKNKFETSAKLKQHLKEHISKNFLCDTCGSGFEYKPQLRSHLTEKHFRRDRADMLKHHPEMACINKEINCDLCGEFWANRPLYKQHLRDIHFGGDSVALFKIFPQFEKVSDPPEPVTCDHCSKVCAGLVQLNAHLKVHMKSKHKTRPKVEVDITDDEQDDPVDFTNIEPREMDREYKCQTCDAEFARKAALEKHLTTHHKKDELREALRDIEREELARAELEEKEERKPTPGKSKKKKIVDSSEKLEENKSAGKPSNTAKTTLSAPKTLVKTNVSAEADSSPKRQRSQLHVCKICEEIFKTRIELALHLKDEHDQVDLIHNADEEDCDMGSSEVVDYDLTTLQCFTCDKDFKCRKYLCRHLRKVHEIRQRNPNASLTEDKAVFKCTKCGKGFEKVVNMRRHMAAKHGLRSRANEAESQVKTRGANKNEHKGNEKLEDPDDDYEPMESNSQANTSDSTADITSFLGMNFNLGKAHSCNIESVKKKQHRCRLCGEGFSREATLKKHLVLHDTYTDVHTKPDADDISDLQPAIYPCNACGNMYSTALGLIHHNRSKHADVDEEIVLAQIAEIDIIYKAISPKKKVDKESSKSVKRKYAPGGEDEYDVARKRLKMDQDGRESYDCKFCGAVYYTYKGLSNHERDVHDADKMGSPQKEGATRYSMSGRLITRSKKLSDMIQCDHCTKSFTEEKNLKIHIVRVHNTEVKAEKTKLVDKVVIANKSTIGFKCHLCSKEFGLRVNLRRHMKMKHNVDLQAESMDISATESPEKFSLLVYHCDVCEQKFSTMSILRHHMISVHDENDENTLEIKIEIPSCDVCHQEFATQKTLDIHMRKHTGEKPYTCCLCNKQFISKYQLECHMKKLHAKLWLKKARCKICLMLFETEKAMLKHKVIHLKPVSTIEEPSHHKCTCCEKVFKWKRNLESHVEIYHNGTDPLTCGVCNKVFPDRESIGNHMTEHQGKKTLYSCEICDKSFVKESSLRMHIGQLHKTRSTPGGSLSCDICKNSFTTKMKLLEHMLSHTSMMPHKCEMCSASFKQEFKLKAHALTHTLKYKKAEKLKPVCKEIYKSEKNKEMLTKDQKKDLSQINYKCKKCGKNFNKAWLVRAHAAKAHTPALVVASALSRNNVRTRSRSTSGSSVRPLNKTSQAVQKKAQKQKKMVTKVMKKPIKSVGFCKLCKLKFFKIDAFKLHMKNVHPKPKKAEHSKPSQDNQLKSKKVEKKLALPKPSTSKAKSEQSKKLDQLQAKKTDKSSSKKKTDTSVKKRQEIVGHDCPICKKIFSKRFNLKIHIRNVHKVQMEDSPSKTEVQRKKCLFCTECARVFWSQMQYDSHNKRVHPDKAAVELDKRVMQALNDEIKAEPTDELSSPKQTEFETIKHKCEFCPKVHWTKKLFDEHMLIDHPEHAEEYGISVTDTSAPTIELVNDSEDMMGDMLSVGHYDMTTCDKLSSFPVVSIQRITEKLVSLGAANNEEDDPLEMEVDVAHEESRHYADNSIVDIDQLDEMSRIETESLPIINNIVSMVEMVKKPQLLCDDGKTEDSGFTCVINNVKTVHSNTEMVTKDFQDGDKNAFACTEDTTETTRNKPVDDQYSKEYEKFLKNTTSIDEIQDIAVGEESEVEETEQNEKLSREDIFIEEQSDEHTTHANSAVEKTRGEVAVIEKETVENTVIEDFEKDTAFIEDAEGNGNPLSRNSSITEDCNEEQPTEKDSKENLPIKNYIAEEVAETDTVCGIDTTKCIANSEIEKKADTETGYEQEDSCGDKIENVQGIRKGSSEAENTGDSENDEKEQEGIDWDAIDSEIGAIENEHNLVTGPAKEKSTSDDKSLMLDEDKEAKRSSDETLVDDKFESGGAEQNFEQDEISNSHHDTVATELSDIEIDNVDTCAELMIGNKEGELHKETKDDREVGNVGLACEQGNWVETDIDGGNIDTTETVSSENTEENDCNQDVDEIKEQWPISGNDNHDKVCDVVSVNKSDNIVETVLAETEDIQTVKASTREIVGCSKMKNTEDDKEIGASTEMKETIDSELDCDSLFMDNKKALENTTNDDLGNTKYEEMDIS